MKTLNNNDILKTWLRDLADEQLDSLGTDRKTINSASQPALKEWVRIMGQDPDQIIADHRKSEHESAQDKLKAVMDVLGGGSIDTDEVRDIVKEVITEDVSPSIADINAKVDALSPLAETLEKIADAMSTSTSNRLPIATAVGSGKNPILEVIAPFYVAGADNPTKLVVSAPPSYGKSFSVGLLGRSYETFITHGCSGDMDEWSMLLGGCTPKKEGGFITVDGKLTEAVRSASEGKNTLFFMDEVFRMSPTTMEAMLAFLAPQKDANGELIYQLTTKQNDAGVLETLTCKADKLHIICATNLCEVTPPEAFMDRFLFKHIRYEDTMVASISESVADTYGIQDADQLAGRFAMAMGLSRKKFGEGQIQKPLSIRDLERACTHATDSTPAHVCEWLINNGMDALLMWNSDTGDIIADSEQGVKDIADLLV